MKSNIILHSTKDMSREAWLAFRFRGIGASEAATVLGLDPYKSSIQLFYEKIGEYPQSNVQNIMSFLGKNQEEFIADMWEYWENDQETMIANFEAGKRVRRCKRVNAYAINDKYPWLFVSLDFEINKHGERGNGSLETKTIGGYNADKWEGGIPPGYLIQVYTQCLVCEYLYGEIAIMKDNRDFNVVAFDHSPEVAATIIEKTGEFWDRVLKARVLITRREEARKSFNFSMVEEIEAEIITLEPPADGSDAYNAFLKEKYKIALPGERRGTPEELAEGLKHKDAKARIALLDEEKQLYENRIKSSMRDGEERIDFGPDGFISWKANKNGSRMFLNKLK